MAGLRCLRSCAFLRFRGMIHASNIFSAMPSAPLGTRFLIHEPCAAFPLHSLVAFKYLALAPILLLNLPSTTPHASISILHSHPAEKNGPQIKSQRVSFPSFPCLRSPLTLHFGQAGTGAERDLTPGCPRISLADSKPLLLSLIWR